MLSPAALEIISEASRRLPEDMKQRHPDVPWVNIAGAGNVYRHDYEDVASGFVWKTVRSELDGIAQAVEAELTKSQQLTLQRLRRRNGHDAAMAKDERTPIEHTEKLYVELFRGQNSADRIKPARID